MCALHRTTTNVQWRTDPSVGSNLRQPHGVANDVHYGIDRANFVEMNFLFRHSMNLRLGGSQQVETHLSRAESQHC